MNLIEAYVIETLKAGTGDLAYTMVWHKELFLPAHKHIFTIAAILVMEVRRLFGLLTDCTPGGKPRPSFYVVFVGGTPVLVARLEGVLRANDLTFKASGEGSMFRRQAYSLSVLTSSFACL